MRPVFALAWLALAVAPAEARAQADAGEAPDAGDTPDAGQAAPSPIEPFEQLEAFDPIESFDAPGSAPDAGLGDREARLNRAWAELSSLAAVDTRFDPAPAFGTPEDVVEARLRTSLGADVRFGDGARMVLEVRTRWRVMARAGLDRPRAEVEARPGDAFLDLYGRWADVRIGWQRVPLGANALLAPADALNPRDLREGLFPGSGDPEASALSVLALRAQGEVGPLRWLLAYAPFFEPNRYAVFGQDEALLQPAAEVALPFEVDPSIEPRLQEHLLETSRPDALGLSGDLAARVRLDLGRGHAGLGWLWGNEKLPQVEVDAELAAALKARSLGRPIDPAILLSLQNRVAAGESLYRGTYPRQHVLWAEGSAIAGPVQVDLDLAWSPARTFGTDALATLRRPSVTWVAGVSPAEESELVYSATYLGMAVPGVPADELLFLIEPATARGAARTGWFHLLALAASYQWLDGRLEVGGALAFEPIQRSLLFAPQVSWEPWPELRLGAALELYAGSPASPFGYFDRNDRVLVSAVWRPR